MVGTVANDTSHVAITRVDQGGRHPSLLGGRRTPQRISSLGSGSTLPTPPGTGFLPPGRRRVESCRKFRSSDRRLPCRRHRPGRRRLYHPPLCYVLRHLRRCGITKSSPRGRTGAQPLAPAAFGSLRSWFVDYPGPGRGGGPTLGPGRGGGPSSYGSQRTTSRTRRRVARNHGRPPSRPLVLGPDTPS